MKRSPLFLILPLLVTLQACFVISISPDEKNIQISPGESMTFSVTYLTPDGIDRFELDGVAIYRNDPGYNEPCSESGDCVFSETTFTYVPTEDDLGVHELKVFRKIFGPPCSPPDSDTHTPPDCQKYTPELMVWNIYVE